MMTDHELDEKTTSDPAEAPEAEVSLKGDLVRADDQVDLDGGSSAPAQLGATRHVLAGFFAAGIAIAYLVGKVLSGTWNRLADNAWLAQRAPFLSRIAEDDRPTYTTLLGAVIGAFVAIYAYRRPDVRSWTNEVAAELAKVSWPSKKEVTNSTMVVILTGTFATVFLALLDRFWGFVTNLVYGS
jgi:preprotein translocase subunit SecE